MGAAIAHLACYCVMMLVSYFWGQRVFPIPYQIGRISIYCILAFALFIVSNFLTDFNIILKLTINTLMLISYIAIVFVLERKNPLKIE